MIKTWILAGAIIVAGLLIGGRFTPVPVDGISVFVVDRYTGTVWHCGFLNDCIRRE